MSLLALIISYFLQQKLELSLSIKFDRITLKTLLPDQFSMMVKNQASAFLLLLLILVAYFSLFYVLLFLVQETLWAEATLVVETLVLLLLIGQRGFKQQLENYLSAWKRGSFNEALRKQQAITKIKPDLLRDPADMNNEVSKSLLYHHFNRFFVISFWYMVAGPAMAVLVRVSDLIAQHSSDQLKRVSVKVNHIIEWLPARLLGLTFSLSGHFKKTVAISLREFIDLTSKTPAVLASAGLSTLGSLPSTSNAGRVNQEQLITAGVDSVIGVRRMLSRSMAVWLGVFAIVEIMTF